MLNSRYELVKLLGDGTFGRVVLANDTGGSRQVAIKIIRDVERYTESAQIEAAILKAIRRADPQDTSGCVVMHDAFMHAEKFYCLVFEPLGASLYDFVKSNYFRGLWMQDIQNIALQCVQALSFLHGQLRVTHTDLKPENILFESMEPAQAAHFPREAEWLQRMRALNMTGEAGPYMRPASTRIRLIDFGNATHEDEHHSSLINTRQYRSPEVLLALGWDELTDMWSIGCILMELYVGEQLFDTHAEAEHLALVARIVGPLPQAMLDGAGEAVKKATLEKDANSGHWRLLEGSESTKRVCSQRPLAEQIQPVHAEFAGFVDALLRLEPGRRVRAINALMHPFFTARFPD